MRRELALATVVAALACVPPRAPTAPVRAALEYVVDSTHAPNLVVTAKLHTTGSEKLALPEEMAGALVDVAVLRQGKFEPVPTAPVLTIPECVRDCTVRYTLDLTKPERSLDTVAESRGGIVTPTYAWMLRPIPVPSGTTRVTVDAAVDGLPEGTFSDLRAYSAVTPAGFDNDGFNEGSFTAFGALRVAPVRAAGAEIDVVRIGPAPAMGEPALVRWARDAAECVALLFGHFPVQRAGVFVVPVGDGAEVVFGKALSLGGPAVLALTGTAIPESAIHDDWILVHEMIHLGAPTFGGNLRWLGEGIASYYEAVLRTRAGFRTESALWSRFADAMKRAEASPPLDEGSSIDDIYWGGALFLLEADVRLREKGSSLDEVFRAILASGGDATVTWSIEQFIAAAARASKTDVIGELYARHGRGGERFDVAGLFARLGVGSGGLRDDAPDAAIRRTIGRGK